MFLSLVAMPLLLVASLFLVVRPGAPNSVLAPSSDALVTSRGGSGPNSQTPQVTKFPHHTLAAWAQSPPPEEPGEFGHWRQSVLRLVARDDGSAVPNLRKTRNTRGIPQGYQGPLYATVRSCVRNCRHTSYTVIPLCHSKVSFKSSWKLGIWAFFCKPDICKTQRHKTC